MEKRKLRRERDRRKEKKKTTRNVYVERKQEKEKRIEEIKVDPSLTWCD